MDRRAAGRKKRRLAYMIREILMEDLDSGFLETLSNLSDTEGLNFEKAREVLLGIRVEPLHKVFVAVKNNGEVIGTTTLLVEQKFIHNGGRVGHIEEAAVRKGYEGEGVGGVLVKTAVKSAKQLGCYKCVLDCKEKVAEFYERLGFRRYEIGMRKDLK